MRRRKVSLSGSAEAGMISLHRKTGGVERCRNGAAKDRSRRVWSGRLGGSTWPLSLTVDGKLVVNSYYDVIGLGKVSGFLRVNRGGEVKVAPSGRGKLVIGRMTSGWTEVQGKLTVSSDLEIGDTKGTVARLTVDGGEVTAPKLVGGDCDWELSVRGGGKVLISGEACFDKGKGKIRVFGGGVLKAEKVIGIPRPEVEVSIEGGGRIKVAGAGAENMLRGWIDGGKVKSPSPLEVKKIDEKGKTYFEISTK